MSRQKVSTTIYVTPEQNQTLKLLNERTKVPVAVYIREGIDLVLQKYADLLPGQLPLMGELGHASSGRESVPPSSHQASGSLFPSEESSESSKKKGA